MSDVSINGGISPTSTHHPIIHLWKLVPFPDTSSSKVRSYSALTMRWTPHSVCGKNGRSNLLRSSEKGALARFTRALDLSIDQTLHDLIEMITRMKAKRVVIDSLSGFELALAPEFREDFRGSLYRMIAELTNMGITILMIAELEDRYTDLRFSPYGSAFLADAIIVQRYIELDEQFKRVFSVVKVRGSEHRKDIRLYDITDQGVVLGETISEYAGIMSGRPLVRRTLGQPLLPASGSRKGE